MLRRRLSLTASAVSWARFQSASVPQDVRDKLSKSFMSVKEEAKGQALDLGDMAEAARNAAKAVATVTKNHAVDDAKFKAKLVSLNASMKAYNSRLMNLQTEARALQSDVDAILKVLWGSGNAGAGVEEAAAPGPEKVEGERITEPQDFAYEPPKPKVADAPPQPKAASASKVETVEGEVVTEATTSSTSAASAAAPEIEVESVEIEESSDSKSITDITRELHDKNIDFSDCMDSKSLRTRYQEYLDGKVKPPTFTPPKAKQAQPAQPPRSAYQSQPPSSSPSSSSSQPRQQQQQQARPNTTETGLTPDPHPGAERRQIDGSKFVWEVKAEMAREKGLDPQQLDMWCGMVKMEDQKRIYEVPGVQTYPIQIRQKGDVPTSAH